MAGDSESASKIHQIRSLTYPQGLHKRIFLKFGASHFVRAVRYTGLYRVIETVFRKYSDSDSASGNTLNFMYILYMYNYTMYNNIIHRIIDRFQLYLGTPGYNFHKNIQYRFGRITG